MVSLKTKEDAACLQEFILSKFFFKCTMADIFLIHVAQGTKGFGTAVTRLGNHGSPRHCNSPAPFDESLFKFVGNAPSTLEKMYYILFEDKGAGLVLRYHLDSACVVCEF